MDSDNQADTSLPIDQAHLGIDVGGSKILAVVIDGDGKVRDRLERPTTHGSAGVQSGIRSVAAAMAERSRLAPKDIVSVGIGIPGRVTPGSGIVEHAVNLGITAPINLPALIAPFVGRDTVVFAENDVNMAALGASWLLGDRGKNLALIAIGTGLSAGLVVDGRLYRGFSGVAGEIGHIVVDPGGDSCQCGQKGCLELYSSGSTVSRLWKPSDKSMPAAASLFSAENDDNADALAVRRQFGQGIAEAVKMVALTWDVPLICLAGGVSAHGDVLLQTVKDALDQAGAASPFIRSLDLPSRVIIAPGGADQGAVGAAAARLHTQP